MENLSWKCKYKFVYRNEMEIEVGSRELLKKKDP